MIKKLVAVTILGFSVYAIAQFGARRGQFGGGGFGGIVDSGAGQCLVPGYCGGRGMEDLPTPRNINRSAFVYAPARDHVQPNLIGSEMPRHSASRACDSLFPTWLGRLTTTATDA